MGSRQILASNKKPHETPSLRVNLSQQNTLLQYSAIVWAYCDIEFLREL